MTVPRLDHVEPKAEGFMQLQIDLPPDELRKAVARLTVHAFGMVRPAGIHLDQLKFDEMQAVANYLIGGFLGMASKSGKTN